jgi:hypothetical protein
VIEVTALFTDYIAELDSLCRVSKLVSLAPLAIGALLSYATASGSEEEEERLYLEKAERMVLTLYKVIDKLKHDKYNCQPVAEALEEIRRALPREEAL